MISHPSYLETISSTTETANVAPKSANLSETQNVRYKPNWKSNNTNESDRTEDKIYSIDLATFHKQRRNGIQNFPLNEDHRRYFTEFTGRNQFDADQSYYQDRNRNNDDVYPVRVQSCPHYMRDTSRYQNDDNRNGILQGWLGGTEWRGKNEENKQYPLNPSYITTATAKVPASYNRHQGRYHNKYSGGQEKSNVPVKPRIYDFEYNSETPQDNNSKESFNNRHRDYNDYRNIPFWRSPSQSDQNNRIIYYEYNLEDQRRPNNDIQYPKGIGYNCRSFPACEQEMYMHSSSLGRGYFDDRQYLSNGQSRPSTQSKSSSAMYDDNSEPQLRAYVTENSHRFRHPDRNHHGAGKGYVFSLDVPRDRQLIPGSAPSIYMSQYPFGQTQFLDDYNKHDSVTRSPFLHMN